MKELFSRMADALRRGEDLVLCSVIASSGSTPRGTGAKMILFADGSTFGTVGGGAVEFESIKLAKKALDSRSGFTAGFNLSKNQTADIGMICGGQVTVYFQFFGGGDAASVKLFDKIVSLFGMQKNSWLVTRINDGGASRTGLFIEGRGLLNMDTEDETIVSGLLRSRSVLTSGDPSYYVEPVTTAGMVYIFGGGHVSQQLVPVLAHVGFSTVVFEDRPEFCTKELFPDAVRLVQGDFKKISDQISLTDRDYAVIVTRGHQADYDVLCQTLLTDAAYIGMIGSRTKIAATYARLPDETLREEAVKRVHAPIGLPIGGETPEEIAISIAGELIAQRAGLYSK